MKNREKVFIIIAAIILGTFLTWYLQVYKHRVAKPTPKVLVASIPPIKYVVSKIVDNDFDITTLLPEGMSPETYEPTPKQIMATSEAEIIFTTGLIDFENTIINKIHGNSEATIATLSKGIQLIDGESNLASDTDQHNHNCGGIDPHIWTSLSCLKMIAKNAYESIKTLYPDSSKYFDNYLQLIKTFNNADSVINNMITQSDIKYFLIYHPALAYYARDYGIHQISLENEGKEPTVENMKSIIEQAKHDSIKTILYQKQLNESVVATVAKDLEAEPVAFDPLAEEVVQNLLWVTDIITRQ